MPFGTLTHTYTHQHIGVNSGVGWGVATPRFWAGGVVGGRRGSWTGRKILLYLTMYRKYFRKWWLLKRNRIIWPEIAVNSQFLPGKSKFSVKSPKESNFFSEICLENQNFLWNYLKKIKIFRKFALKNRFLCEIAWKNSKFFGNFSRKSKLFVKLTKKSKFFEILPWK